eukprot:scaffold10583_cov118-Isochrysis_galbana.AAC.4
MQVKWLLKYLDASVSTWKLISDCWFARTSLGRAAILTSIPAKILTKNMRGNIALPQFWYQALEALHELKLTQTSCWRFATSVSPIFKCECANLRGAEIPHQGVIIHGGDRGSLATACARRRGT